jgi:pimeloyl-ACP methyl ester carboxylesterase
VLRATGAHRVFGLSAGAIVMLEAALALPAIEKAVIFEPPLAVDGVVPNGWPDQWLPRLDREIGDGNVAAALVTGMKGSQIGPAIFNFMPRWLLERLTRMMVTAEEKNAGPGDVTFTTLAPTLRYDVQLILDTKGAIGRYRDIQAEVLLLGGGKSRPAFLKRVLDALEKVLPRVRRVEFAELGQFHRPEEREGRPAGAGGARDAPILRLSDRASTGTSIARVPPWAVVLWAASGCCSSSCGRCCSQH